MAVKRIRKNIICLALAIIISAQFVCIVSADSKISVRGEVFIDGVKLTPDDIELTIESTKYYALFPGDIGKYGFKDINAGVGAIGTFLVTIPSGSYFAAETLEINSEDNLYLINLTVNTSQGAVPSQPSNPSPSDGATGVDINPTLSVDVYDADGDIMDVTFYDDFDTIIGTDDDVSSGSTASVTWNSLSYDTVYNWYAIANDGESDSPKSTTWSFTTKSQGGGGSPGGGGSTGGGGNPGFVYQNQNPIAVADASSLTVFVDESINFDGSSSTDDGTIEAYEWDFGDGTIGSGETISHSYNTPGTYSVQLSVTDNDGAMDMLDNPLTITVTQPNSPPDAPQITGPMYGDVDESIIYTITVTDDDVNDTLEFILSWGDTSMEYTSENHTTGDSATLNHTWTSYGMYTIRVDVYDQDNATNSNQAIVYIDVYPIDDEIKGLLIDMDSDDTYDVFNNTATNDETVVELHTGQQYLIDHDGDDTWDYLFDIETDTLTAYTYEETQTDDNLGIYLLILIIIILFVILAYIMWKREQTNKKKAAEDKKKEQAKKDKTTKSSKSTKTKSSSKKKTTKK